MIGVDPPMRPFSEACEQNKDPILSVLRERFHDCRQVLEIGSGTGQHAVYFGAHLPHLIWQPSDLPEYHAGIRAWLAEAQLANVRAPLALNVNDPLWPVDAVDAVFSANTTHIMGYPEVARMFAGIGQRLAPGGVFALYGPFNYAGNYTSESNARFDRWLKARDRKSGIRNFEDLDALANDQGMRLDHDYPMPANNRTLVWKKSL